MGTIWEKIREGIIGWLESGLHALFDSIHGNMAGLSEELAKTPDTYNATLFSLMKAINENAVLPVALFLFALFAFWELISIINERNSFNDIELGFFIRWFIKLLVGNFLIANAFSLCMGVFDIANVILLKAGLTLNEFQSIQIETIIKQFVDSLDDTNFFWILIYAIIIWVLVGVVKLALILTYVMIYSRIIHLYLLLSVSSLPISTFMNKELSQTGQNFLKLFFATCLQGFVIILLLSIYAASMANVLSTLTSVKGFIFELFVYSILLSMLVIKSESLAKQLIGVH